MAMAGVGYLAIAAASLLAMSMTIPAIAQTITIIELDEVYELGDKIVIAGTVKPVVGDLEMTMQVKRGSNVIDVAQLKVSRDGSFGTILNTDGGNWEEGEHSVQVNYQEGVTARQTFEISAEPVETGPEEVEGTVDVDIGEGEKGTIEYTISGGSVTDMTISREVLGLTVYIDPETDGSISFTADREYFDARTDGCGGDDSGFIVVVDDRELEPGTEYEAVRGETANTISLDFFEDEKRIQVIGTCVIPEFGAMAMVVLAISAAAAIAAAAIAASGRLARL